MSEKFSFMCQEFQFSTAKGPQEEDKIMISSIDVNVIMTAHLR